MAKKPQKPSEVPDWVSLRFLAFATGLNYGAATALAVRNGVRVGAGRLRFWPDLVRTVSQKLVAPEALKLLLKHVPVAVNEATPIDVPGDVYRAMKAAWQQIRAPGCPLLTTKDDVSDIPEGLPVSVKLDLVRLATQEEQLRYKKLVSRRLESMMCDRNVVEAECRQLALKIQRWMRNVPARFAGVMVKSGMLSDAELRIFEKLLQEETPILLRELLQEISAIPANAAAVSATRRYQDRNWSVQTGGTA